jgi:inosine-uridine nucleoside N-ribohydrolase
MLTRLLAPFVLLPALVALLPADEPKKVPIILDTDIGTAVDDAFALGLVTASPELDLVGVTTCGEDASDRAWLACRFLTQVGVKAMPVAAGANPQPAGKLDEQIQYRRHPAAIFNRTLKPVKESAVEWLAKTLQARPGEITLVCIGPLTNIARLLKEHPDAKGQIKRIVLMGGSIDLGYDGKKGAVPEWNIKSDIPAAKAVFGSGVPLVVVPLDATVPLTLNRQQREDLFGVRNMLTLQVQNLYELWDTGEMLTLFDPSAVAAVIDEKFFTWREAVLRIEEDGTTRQVKGEPNARVAIGVDADRFRKWYIDRLKSWGKESPPREEKNPSKLIERGNFPVRVHAFEDYETDIERRWWMSGRGVPNDGTHPGKRVCRAMLTLDFDDRQGDLKTMYRAVIFNPVPGPPMGPRTRLSFRYKLTGTDVLRVQLYSLTNGYHRYLSLHGLPQGKWAEGCVDMTDMRRPDGTGGPLAENERIDDIQFYVPASAELLIDDINLFEAAVDGEKRPFPTRPIFTAWFDTGKQGKEWPGDFEIVPHEAPRTWKAAHSIPDPEGKHWIRLDLRGERPLDAAAELFFLYRTKGDKPVEVELYSRASKRSLGKGTIKPSATWTGTTVSFDLSKVEKPAADEIRFRAPDGELWIDDLLLYTPGR